MSHPKPSCERCGAPALVHITNEAAAGATMRHLCLECADLEQPQRPVHDRFLNYGAILIVIGVFVVVISVFADQFKFGNSEGFGPLQKIGLGLAVICVFTAALIRVPTLLVIGVLAGGLTILADMFQFGQDPEFGWHQMVGAGVGVTLVLSGWLESRRQS